MEKRENNWGVGKKANEKAFASVIIGNEKAELIWGEHPHSRQDNNMYARKHNGTIYSFSGHRLCFKIEIEEHNYLKSSSMSGDEIRKGCSGKLFVNGVQCFDTFHRNYDSCYRVINQFILDMEMNWGWFPFKTEEWQGKTIGYREQLFVIKHFIVEQACMILETVDGQPRKKFHWEEDEDFDGPTKVKVDITSDAICWYPK